MTPSMVKALAWLKAHNGDGVFDHHNVLLAAGERGPFMKATWNALRDMGLIQYYGSGFRRVRIRPQP